MIAHTIYPRLTREPVLSTVSHEIITGILKQELGFSGAITSDNLLMTGLIKEYEIIDACTLALNAGMTLLLLRDEGPLVDEIYHGLVQRIRDRVLPESVVDEAIYRNLSTKWDYGLFEDGGIVDPAAADEYQRDEMARSIEHEVGRKAVVLTKNRASVIPVAKSARVLLIDQVSPSQHAVNTFTHHPAIFWEKLLERSPRVVSVEVEGWFPIDEANERRVIARCEEADVVVMTNYQATRGSKPNNDFVVRLKAKLAGKPLIIVTDAPYQPLDEVDTELVLFSDTPASLAAAADILFGDCRATGMLPVDRLA